MTFPINKKVLSVTLLALLIFVTLNLKNISDVSFVFIMLTMQNVPKVIMLDLWVTLPNHLLDQFLILKSDCLEILC